ncbi:MAG: tetratricopeptide repeat protein [Planctomycetota bacterium]
MSDARWDRLQEVFEAAAVLAVSERSAYLDVNCGDDKELRREVEELLSFSGDSPAFEPLTPFAGMVQVESPLDSGTTVGPFRLQRIIGAGGMGRVYEAQQLEPQRTVALKMIKVALVNDSDRRRFRYETETLAQLQHPHIAQLYQVGTHVIPGGLGDELPYFAMEYVPNARTILDHVAQESLSVAARLRLFQDTCAAVQHGHQRGVMHRDLKPANILVGSDGIVKVIDFGIARAVESEANDTQLTAAGALVGTIAYMAPERLVLPDAAPDVRGDVYALGVVLFQLLGGAYPHDLSQVPAHEVAHVVQNTPARRLSELNPQVPRELEWIVGRAIAPDVERRYDSPAALAEDIDRFQRNEPVIAGRPNVGYRLRKFVRRNRVAVAAGSVVLLTLIVALIGVTSSLQQVRTQFTQKTEAVTFFTEMLMMSDPELGGRDVLLFDAVQRHAGRINDEFPEQPAVRLLLHTAVGNVLGSLGYHTEAETHLVQAYDLSVALHGRDETLASGPAGALGSAWMHLGKYKESEQLLVDVVAARKQHLAPDDRRTALASKDLGVLYRDTGRPREALAAFRTAHETARSQLGADDPDTIRCAVFHAASLHALHRYDEEAECIEECWDTVREDPHTNPALTLAVRNQLALLYLQQQQLEHAEALLLAGLEEARRPFGERHPERFRVLHNLGSVYRAQGRLAAAESVLREAIAGLLQANAHSLDALRAKQGLASVLHDAGKSTEAQTIAREVLAEFSGTRGRQHPVALATANVLGVILIGAGEHEEAEPLLRQTISLATANLGAHDPITVQSHVNLGAALLRQKRYVEAETILRPVLEARSESEPNSPALLTVMSNVAHAVSEQGRTDEAKELLAALIAKAIALDLTLHPTLLTARSNLGSILSAEGDYAAAAEQYVGVLEIRERALGTKHPATILTMNNVAVTLQRQGDLSGAVDYLGKAIAAASAVPDFNPERLAQFQFNQATCLWKLERNEEALTVMQQSHDALLRWSGPDDEWTVDAAKMIKELQERLAAQD